jgi:hypothetical protein
MSPQYKRGQLFNSDASVIGVSTNSFLASNQRLVMGRGAALSLSRIEPEMPFHAGRFIKNSCGHLGRYGWFAMKQLGWKRHYGLFQVKYSWRDPADLGLIRYSVDMLNDWVKGRNTKVAINFPGIGNGRQEIEKVFTIVDEISSDVTIYYFEENLTWTLDNLIRDASIEVPF